MGFINNIGYEVKIGSSSEEIYILKWLGCYDPICIAAFTDIFVHLNTGRYKLFEWFAMVVIYNMYKINLWNENFYNGWRMKYL